ncbi:MAG: Stp1/IreP family PP2C-type Ser/Thr phosphatase [Coprobacillus sp.]|nr:Stp1/IreP family PP2C-type Ser/Thr phosphatase [Coprobacillus sp.]
MSKKLRLLNGSFIFKSDVGKVREVNEDRCVALRNAAGDVLLCVCDGMGGQNKGDYASELTINTIEDSFKIKNKFRSARSASRWLKNTVRDANNRVYTTGATTPEYQGMGTTVTIALLIKGSLLTAQVGDSRCYSYSSTTLEQLTEDQSYVQYLYNAGKISEQEKEIHQNKNVLTNALGTFPSLSLDIRVSRYKGESLFLCSDGVYNSIPKVDIENILHCHESLAIKADMLISTANSYGAKDNLSVILWECAN